MKKRFLNRKRMVTVGLTVGLAAAMTGAAFAYFTTNGGSGSGTA